jgi:hypothetical protein
MMTDQNNLSALSYKIKISGATNLEMRCQSVLLPGVNLGTFQVATPFIMMQEPTNFSYGSPLVITFMVGENLADYLEVYNWMTGLGQPDGFDRPYNRKFSDASIMILNSAYKTIFNVRFEQIFPLALSQIEFSSTLTEVQYITAQASFNFDRFYYDKIEP